MQDNFSFWYVMNLGFVLMLSFPCRAEAFLQLVIQNTERQVGIFSFCLLLTWPNLAGPCPIFQLYFELIPSRLHLEWVTSRNQSSNCLSLEWWSVILDITLLKDKTKDWKYLQLEWSPGQRGLERGEMRTDLDMSTVTVKPVYTGSIASSLYRIKPT